jgi:hypothetical protein
MEEPASIEQDSAALAEAVVGRAQGDIGAAVAILDTAKAMLIQSGQQQDPRMMNRGGPMYKNMGGPMPMYRNMGGPMYRNMGGPMYAQEGMPITDTETMKQMIMNSIKENPMLSRTLSDKDSELTALSNSGMNYQNALDMLVKQRRSSTN